MSTDVDVTVVVSPPPVIQVQISTLVSVALAASPPLVYDSIARSVSLPKANATQDGYLSASDWVNFANSAAALAVALG